MTFTEKIEDILPEIDIDTGLMYCGDDEELFEEVVGEFIDGEMTASIEENYKNENWKDYQIQVHAVKGTSLTIGAKQWILSSQSKKVMLISQKSITRHL
mgnify:CR=1 FL=1